MTITSVFYGVSGVKSVVHVASEIAIGSSVVATVPYDDWDDSPCVSRKRRSWKCYRSTQYHNAEPSAKVLMPVLLALDAAY